MLDHHLDALEGDEMERLALNAAWEPLLELLP